MQISRHWRMNAQRYRLEGVRYKDGTVSLQNRPLEAVHNVEETAQSIKEEIKQPVAEAA